VAITNKNARTIWSLIVREQDYRCAAWNTNQGTNKMLSNDMLELPTVAQLVRAASSEPEGGRSSEDGGCGMLVARRYFVDEVKLNKQTPHRYVPCS